MNSFPTPESILRVERMGPHFTKYHLGDGRVLHRFTEAADEFYHDHPWPFRTTILSGGYVEEIAVMTADGKLATEVFARLPTTSHQVEAGTIHKLIRLIANDCWKLVEPGQTERKSGFYRADVDGVWHRFHDGDWRLIVQTFTLI